MPAFVKPAIYNLLKEKFNLIPTTTAKEDIAAILTPKAAAKAN